MERASLPGKSRAPWTSALCLVPQNRVWTGATHGSGKLTGRCWTRESPTRLGRLRLLPCALKTGLDWCNPTFAETHRSLQHPGKSRPPWTTVRCSMRSLWAWTGATHGSPKLTGLYRNLGAPAPSPAHVSKTTMVTWREPPPRGPRMSYRALTPHSPAGGGAGAPRKVPRTLDEGALFDAFDMGLDGCNPGFAETHRSLRHPGKSRHRTRSVPAAPKAGHCEARKTGIVGERPDGFSGNHPSPETVSSHCPPPDAGEGSDAGCPTTRVRRRGGRAGRRG